MTLPRIGAKIRVTWEDNTFDGKVIRLWLDDDTDRPMVELDSRLIFVVADITWVDLVELPAPDLAELVGALHMTVGYWHLSSHGGSDPFGECGAADCANLRALLAKHEVQP